MIAKVLVVHLGTFLAALVYFHRVVKTLLQTLFRYAHSDRESHRLLIFLILSTGISGAVGLLFLKGLSHISEDFAQERKWITLAVGVCLLITGFLLLKARPRGFRTIKDLRLKDSLLLGLMQGAAVLPGLSRFRLTISALLLTRFKKTPHFVRRFFFAA